MARWTPDPTFYPSPRLAGGPAGDARLCRPGRADAGGPARRARRGRPRPARRPSYGQIVVHARDAERRRRAAPLRLERVQRRALPVRAAAARRAPLSASCPDCARSRIHILDTKPDPRAAASSCKTIEREDDGQRTGYSRRTPSTAVPTAIYVNALGAPTAATGRRDLHARPRDVRRCWAPGRSTAARSSYAYDFWWHLGPRHDALQRVGHAGHGRERRRPRDAARPASTATRCTSGTCASARHLQALDLGDRAADGARAAAGARPAQGVRLRRRGRLARGPVRVGLAVVPRRTARRGRSRR